MISYINEIMATKNYWTLKERPHTKLKLEIYRKYLDSWCSIFKSQPHFNDVYIVDCFAGKGDYDDGQSDGSPLIAIKAAKKFQNDFLENKNKNKKYFKIHCIFIECKSSYVKNLEKLLLPYKDFVDYKIFKNDFNQVIKNVLREIKYCPTLFFIDPYGIKTLKRESVEAIVAKKGGKDIILNYIQEGVERIGGLAKKCLKKDVENISIKEIKTIINLKEFMGGLDCVVKSEKEALKMYIEEVIKGHNKNVQDKDKLEAIAFDMKYPHKRDTIYYLIFASRNNNAIKIVKQVFAKSKEIGFNGQGSLFSARALQKIDKDFEV